MREKAIEVIEKQLKMYQVLCKNFDNYGYFRRKVERNKYRKDLIKEIKVREYILEILQKQR